MPLEMISHQVKDPNATSPAGQHAPVVHSGYSGVLYSCCKLSIINDHWCRRNHKEGIQTGGELLENNVQLISFPQAFHVDAKQGCGSTLCCRCMLPMFNQLESISRWKAAKAGSLQWRIWGCLWKDSLILPLIGQSHQIQDLHRWRLQTPEF